MQIQEIFLRASEEYEESGFFELAQSDYDFLISRLYVLNQKNKLSDFDQKEVQGIWTILLYAERDGDVEKKQLKMSVMALYKKVYLEFVGEEGGY